MMENYSESDEAFARRLQAQEMGNFTEHNHGPVDAQTPLVVSSILRYIIIYTIVTYPCTYVLESTK